MHIWWEYSRSDAVFSMHPNRRCTISIRVFIDDVHDHLVKVMSARLLHCKVTFFFGIN